MTLKRPKQESLLMPMFIRSVIAASLIGLAVPVLALDTNVPATGLPSASVFSSQLMPDRPGVVSWKTLASVEPISQGAKMVPRFSKEILALDKKQVRVQGFILALDTAQEQKHFLVSAVPPHCSFCIPAGPDAVVEVFAKKPVRYGMEPIVLSGKLAVLKNDPTGVLYRLTDAEPVDIGVK
jgi:hypothetical protein